MRDWLLKQAQVVADTIKSQSGIVTGVELFGSLARNEASDESDIDLIVLVPEDFYQAWIQACDFGDWGNPYTDAKHERAFSAEEVLNAHFPWTYLDLDIFLFPENWRDHLDRLQEEGRHSDPLFMHNICADARQIA